MADFGITSTIGDDRTLRVSASWPVDVPELGVSEGDPYPLETAQKVWFTAKLNRSDDDVQAVVSKTTDAVEGISGGGHHLYRLDGLRRSAGLRSVGLLRTGDRSQALLRRAGSHQRRKPLDRRTRVVDAAPASNPSVGVNTSS